MLLLLLVPVRAAALAGVHAPVVALAVDKCAESLEHSSQHDTLVDVIAA